MKSNLTYTYMRVYNFTGFTLSFIFKGLLDLMTKPYSEVT